MSKIIPLVKWAGGKRGIMTELTANFPKVFNNYYELFMGGGSVVCELYNNGLLDNKEIHCSDFMAPLINMYEVVRDNPQELCRELSKEEYKNDEESFYVKRAKYNTIKHDLESTDKIKCAALFLFLNKTCFNGMYREINQGYITYRTEDKRINRYAVTNLYIRFQTFCIKLS